jgi:hypothetical protein
MVKAQQLVLEVVMSVSKWEQQKEIILIELISFGMLGQLLFIAKDRRLYFKNSGKVSLYKKVN